MMAMASGYGMLRHREICVERLEKGDFVRHEHALL